MDCLECYYRCGHVCLKHACLMCAPPFMMPPSLAHQFSCTRRSSTQSLVFLTSLNTHTNTHCFCLPLTITVMAEGYAAYPGEQAIAQSVVAAAALPHGYALLGPNGLLMPSYADELSAQSPYGNDDASSWDAVDTPLIQPKWKIPNPNDTEYKSWTNFTLQSLGFGFQWDGRHTVGLGEFPYACAGSASSGRGWVQQHAVSLSIHVV